MRDFFDQRAGLPNGYKKFIQKNKYRIREGEHGIDLLEKQFSLSKKQSYGSEYDK